MQAHIQTDLLYMTDLLQAPVAQGCRRKGSLDRHLLPCIPSFHLHPEQMSNHPNFYFVEETASNLVRFQYQEGGGVFEDRSSGKSDEQDG